MKLMTNRALRVLVPARRIAYAAAASVIAGVLMASCDVHTPTEVGSIATLEVTPDVTLAILGTQQFTAIARDAEGREIAVSPEWSVVEGGGAIGGGGMFTAGTTLGVFTATVQATFGGMTGTATVTVIAGPLAAITVTPDPTTMPINGTQQFVAVGTDAGGNVVPITPTWSVAAGGGTINSTSGLFLAGTTIGPFPNTILATSGGIGGTASITVTVGPLATIEVTPDPKTMPAGTTQQYTAVGRDAGGNIVNLSPVWSVEEGGGTITSSGLFTAGNTLGTFAQTVQATSGSISDEATVTVTAGALATITVTPDPVTLEVGENQVFTAVGRDAGGNVVAITPTWSVEEDGGSISMAGVFTAGDDLGTFDNTVQATSGGISGNATVTVTAGSIATITVTPNPETLGTGDRQQFTAVGRDGRGNIVSISPVWTVENGGGTISSSGMFTAGGSAGTFGNTVEATSGGVSGNATVIVTSSEPPSEELVTITVTPDPATMATGGTRQFTAVGRDQDGNVVAITPVWSVENGGGVISSTGLFTAGNQTGTFNNTVQATDGGISGNATVTVTSTAPPPPGVLVTIVVTPDPATMDQGDEQQFTATGYDAEGEEVEIDPEWTVENDGGTINANGRFTAGNESGTFNNTVVATDGAVSGEATVIVNEEDAVPAIDLGAAESHGILAGSTITCVALGVVNADASVSPGSAITGFPPCVITGATHAADAFAATAQLALTSAYNQLDGMECRTTITSDLGGTTLAPGVYCSTSSVGVSGEMFLDAQGDANAVFVIKAASTLTANAARVTLLNNADAANVYWLVGSSATLGVNSVMVGNIITFTSITLNDNATLLGRALARNGAVTLGSNNVITLP